MYTFYLIKFITLYLHYLCIPKYGKQVLEFKWQVWCGQHTGQIESGPLFLIFSFFFPLSAHCIKASIYSDLRLIVWLNQLKLRFELMTDSWCHSLSQKKTIKDLQLIDLRNDAFPWLQVCFSIRKVTGTSFCAAGSKEPWE